MSRILFASHPWDGHYGPLTRLAVHLKGRGHDVRWYTASIYAERLARLGIPHYPFMRAKEITADNLTEHFPDYETKPMDGKTACEFFFAPIERNYRDVCEIHTNGFPFDAVICDTAMHMSRIVAEKLPVKVYVVAPAPTPAPTSAAAPAPFFGFKPARSVIGRLRDHAVTWLLRSTMKMGLCLFNELREREGLPPYVGSLFDIHVEKSRAIFQIGVPGLDFPRDDWPANFRFIGALLPERRAMRLSPALEANLARYPSAIAVSQGTTDNRDPGKLFVPSLEALADSQHLVVVTTGGRHTGALRQRFPQDNVVIEDWIDFHALLPQTDLFICNGGYGSILLALSNGVPLLCAGKLEGKADINARLDYRGLAVDLRTERPTKKQIRIGIAQVLGDPRYAERVCDLQRELSRYQPCEIIEQTLAADGIIA